MSFKWISEDVVQGRKFTEPGEPAVSMIGKKTDRVEPAEWHIVWCDGRVSLPYTRQKIADILNSAEAEPVT